MSISSRTNNLNDFSFFIKQNDKYNFDQINYSICSTQETSKFMKFEFILNGKLSQEYKLTGDKSPNTACQLKGQISVNDSLRIDFIKLYNYLTDEFCFEICFKHVKQCELLGAKNSNDSIAIRAQKGYDIIGFYGLYEIKNGITSICN
jgi:hypothetical protein